MRTTERRPSRWLVTMVTGAVMFAITSTAGAEAALWQDVRGDTGASDYETVTSVAFGPDGSFYSASQRTAVFGGDPTMVGFELVIRQHRIDGGAGFETVVGQFGTGLAEVDLGVDGAGDIWVFVDRSQLVVIDATGVVVAEPPDLPVIVPDATTTGAASSGAGFVLAEPGAGTARLVQRDGTTAWTHPLDPDIDLGVGVVPVDGGATALVACRDDADGPGLLVEQLSSSGELVGRSDAEGHVPVRSGSDLLVAGQLANRRWVDHSVISHSVLVLVAEASGGSCSADLDAASMSFYSHSVENLTGTLTGTGFVTETACVPVGDETVALPSVNGCGSGELTIDVSTDTFDTSVGVAVSSGRDLAVVVEEGGGRQTLARFSSGSPGVPLGELVGAARLEPGFTVHDMAFDELGNMAVVGEVSPTVGGSVNPRGFVLTNPWVPWFHDVGANWQIRPVEWLWNTGLTTGVAPWLYGPESLLTRAEGATFLYRAVGEPEVDEDHGFVDVVKEWQQAPIRWLKANGITTGVDELHYAPERPISRGEFAVMMWRAVGEPAGSPVHPFSDVTKLWQEEAIRWLKDNGITTGVDATHFAPEKTLTRGEAATFLYRLGMVVDLPSLA
jgi:hypothetical protein